MFLNIKSQGLACTETALHLHSAFQEFENDGFESASLFKFDTKRDSR